MVSVLMELSLSFLCLFFYGVGKCSNFILLHAAIQFSQHLLLKKLSFIPLYILSPYIIDYWTIHAWVYFWALFCSVDLCVSFCASSILL